MRVLILHNRYQIAGGEDGVVRAEKALLEAYGHSVDLLEINNDDITSFIDKAKTALGTIYSFSSKKLLSKAISGFSPDVVHVHNFFPKLSPSIYFACKALNVPVVQTLHNYRFFCANYSFFREGKVCENCLHESFPISGVVHKCYKSSTVGTAIVSTMQFVHRQIGTWNHMVDRYIAPTEFVLEKFIEAGLPRRKFVIKPNFLESDPGIGQGTGKYALFVGRLVPEKGIGTLLKAWQELGSTLPLKIVGEGPLEDQVGQACDQSSGIEWLGKLPRDNVIKLMKDAHALIFPSLWYEVFPLVIVESYAIGLPIISSKIGSQSSLIQHQRTGLHFEPGSVNDLISQVEWSLENPTKMTSMRQFSRQEYESKYTANQNYEMLMNIYGSVIKDPERSV